MKAKEFNEAMQQLMNRALEEGVTQNVLSFEVMIGVIESHKHALFQWRQNMQAMAALQAQESPRIIRPNGTNLPTD